MALKVKVREQYQNVGKGRLRGQILFDSSHLKRNLTPVPTISRHILPFFILIERIS